VILVCGSGDVYVVKKRMLSAFYSCCEGSRRWAGLVASCSITRGFRPAKLLLKLGKKTPIKRTLLSFPCSSSSTPPAAMTKTTTHTDEDDMRTPHPHLHPHLRPHTITHTHTHTKRLRGFCPRKSTCGLPGSPPVACPIAGQRRNKSCSLAAVRGGEIHKSCPLAPFKHRQSMLSDCAPWENPTTASFDSHLPNM
jgi:hypothetical protein